MGHSWGDIQNYSFGQIKLFLEAEQKLKNQAQAATITATRLAAWGQGKEVSKVVHKLSNY